MRKTDNLPLQSDHLIGIWVGLPYSKCSSCSSEYLAGSTSSLSIHFCQTKGLEASSCADFEAFSNHFSGLLMDPSSNTNKPVIAPPCSEVPPPKPDDVSQAILKRKASPNKLLVDGNLCAMLGPIACLVLS